MDPVRIRGVCNYSHPQKDGQVTHHFFGESVSYHFRVYYGQEETQLFSIDSMDMQVAHYIRPLWDLWSAQCQISRWKCHCCGETEGPEEWPPIWMHLVLEPVESKTEHVRRPIHARLHILTYLISYVWFMTCTIIAKTRTTDCLTKDDLLDARLVELTHLNLHEFMCMYV